MHVSLDSALGRQRRLNSVGESITQIAPDPSAAYSLRSLTGSDPKVVRVRRESDNTEKDFTASDINSGELVDFVNRQVIKPLDVKELNSGGSGDRDGNFVIAKAAYSLRSLGDRQATVAATNDTVARADGKYVVQVRRNVDGTIKSFTADEVSDGTLASFVNESFTSSLPLDVQGSAAAAYSLRNLSSSYSGAVVNVRRSSDDTTRDFTADSITNGDLLTFVNEDVTIYQSDFSAGVNGFTQTSTTTLTGNQDGVSDEAGTTKDNVLKAVKASDAQGYIQRDQGVVAGLTYTVSGTFFAPTSNTSVDGIMIKDGLSGSALSNFPSGYLTSGGLWTDFSFSYTATASGNQRINFGISSLASNPTSSSTGSTGDIFYISDLKFVETTADGHVATWYDQSGNSNHATQGTAGSQPKIVDAGSYLGEVDFGGTDDVLNFTSIDFSTNPWFAASVFKYDNTASAIIGGGSTQWITNIGSSINYSARNTQDSTIHNFASPSAFVDGSTNLVTVFRTGDTLSGSANGNFDSTALPVIESNDTFQADRLSLRGSTYGTVNVKEVIVYNSDQSEKRRAIEESIATNYSITLASFSRDGMVRTWYDQSVTNQGGATATGNHAVQATAGSQPIIVSSGVLEDGIKFAASNDGSSADFLQVATRLGTTTDHFITTVISKYQTAATVFGGIISTRKSSTGFSYGISGGSKPQGFYYASSGNAFSLATAELANDCPRTILSFDKDGDTLTGFTNGATNGVSLSQGFDTPSSTITNIGVAGGVESPTDTGLQCNIDEFIVYETDQADNQGAFEANIAEHYNISGIPAEDNQVNGFVETWYDQSGNGNNAVQATSTNQPKIVENGGLVTVNSKPAIKLDGSDNYFIMDSEVKFNSSASDKANTILNVAYIVSGNRSYLGLGSGTFNWFGVPYTTNYRYRDDGGNVINTGDAVPLNQQISFTFVSDESNDIETYQNGTSIHSDNSTFTTHLRIRNIGRGYNGVNYNEMSSQEIVFYADDKTSDIADLHNNINNYYGI